MKKLFAWLGRIPHLFSKVIVVYCIAYVSYAGIKSLQGQMAGMDMTPLFIAIGATFITELAMTFIQSLKRKREKDADFENNITE